MTRFTVAVYFLGLHCIVAYGQNEAYKQPEQIHIAYGSRYYLGHTYLGCSLERVPQAENCEITSVHYYIYRAPLLKSHIICIVQGSRSRIQSHSINHFIIPTL